MRSFLIVICLITGGMLHSQTKSCECGDYETGRTFYQIVDEGVDVGCCSGTATGTGIFVTYTPGEGNTWEVAEVEELEASDAQSNCCNQ